MKRSILFITVFAMILAIFAVPTALGTDDVYTDNCAPIAENLEFKTYQNVAIEGSVSAVDPEGDSVTFYISDAPKKGEIEFSETGDFIYTPKDDAKGKDKFTYYAMDAGNGKSNVATVTVVIEKQKTAVWYSDLEGTRYHYAALTLAEKGIYVGESLAGKYFFSPDEPITRGRFLAMCMNLCGTETIGGVIKTGYTDNASIPMWTKPYAAAALMTGVLDSSQKELKSEDTITYGEAMVILDNAMNITDVYCDSPEDAAQAFANLSACRIVANDEIDAEAELTMGKCAEMLAAARDVLDRR